ncbi:hypothetical protein [Collinsella aerofaciens]|uniref:hypothetical protein n=1 Tax=Collinsella aerofaciens TaxID=74426 RepID=UPI0034A267E1
MLAIEIYRWPTSDCNGAVGCAHDMDISGDFSISVNKDGFKFSIGSNFEVATLFNDFLALTPMS